jgi:hypothetical protein
LTVDFDQEEVDATRSLFQEWRNSQSSELFPSQRVVEPSDHRQVKLVYEGGRVVSPQGRAGVHQFFGRFYINWLAQTMPDKKDLFAKLGDVFWFDQFRNLGSVLAERELLARPRSEYKAGFGRRRESWAAGVEQLREFLVGWWAYHTSAASIKGQGKDYLKDLERRFAELFPGTKFRGAKPREGVAAPSAKDFYFLLERHDQLYDLAEMSSGEQAVFSLLYDFVRLNIARSIVLIDELELHLHAPAQQALYAALPRLGSDCQFVFSTHSEYLTGVIPDEYEVRLEGARRCL